MYYVYEWYIVETGEVIYVGKGTGQRYKVRKHNKFFNDTIRRFKCESRIIERFEKESDAFSYEYMRIKELKEKGQCVCNIRDGGFGGSLGDWTDEKRKRYSENNAMKSEYQRKRMSEKNPMKNPEISMRVNQKKRRAVIVGNKEYSSIKEACDTLNVCAQTIRLWCSKGINRNGEQCHFKDSEQTVFRGKRYNKGGCRALIYKEKHYESPKDLAEELGISVDRIYRWTKNGFDPYGNSCKYEDDKRELTFIIRKKSHHPVIVNGIHYPTIAEAGRANNVSAQTISDLLNKKYHNPKYICKYDNQHPSQENTDNSILEGSETNG